MTLELTLIFAAIDRVTVELGNRRTDSIPFTSPFTKEDWEDMQWYIESYPVQYAADVDDRSAARIVAKLKVWGQGLFNAVFDDRSAERLFNKFQDAEGEGRQLTIAASQPEILRLPWELLCDPSGTYLVHENPRIAVRRQLAGAGGGRNPIEVKPKAQLRLLMVVSRPDGVGFLDPRSEGQAVLKAIEQMAPGRVVVEFLRPATLTKLVDRLENRKLPAIDIVHFDGHGTFGSKDNQSKEMGYLVFEDEDGNKKLISAEELGDALNRQKVSLMVLSACQSGMVTGDDALGCVAARLTHSGIPAVLAMTYSVLVTTTEQLFGKFYGELAGGESLGVALANARRDLFVRKERGQRWRGTEQIELELSDWFLPAWYQAGGDITLLTQGETPEVESPKHRLPELAEEGFFGRSGELWQIERAFVQGTRRMTIAGFGGQGKTYLAVEAGRWLSQTGMFDAVCFVDYAAFQGVDAVAVAVSTIGSDLDRTFIDGLAVTKALKDCRTLIILDNLESLEAKALQELLTVAKEWSQVGATRLLLTTRESELNHADYPTVNSQRHQLLSLSGLGNERHPEDALRYFQGLMKLPPAPKWGLPKREALIELFKQVDFHPLSIKLVAYQLKEQKAIDVARSLKTLLAAEPRADKQRCLVASLNLSLQRLDEDLLAVLPRLGVFQGGAFQFQIEEVLQFAPGQWERLKAALLRTGLVQVEEIGLPFLRFHPTLAPVLWGRLTAEERGELRLRHQHEYYKLVSALYHQDSKNPEGVREIAKRELPNLLWAVKGALEDEAENAAEFVNSVNKFLGNFGFKKDRASLTERLNRVVGKVGSHKWYLVRSNEAEELFNAGQYAAAAELFAGILRELDPAPSSKRVKILIDLARCSECQAQSSTAAAYLDKALTLSEQLEPSDDVKRQRGTIYADLGDVLRDLRQFDRAKQAYENSLTIKKEVGDLRGSAVTEGQLGTLAMLQGDLTTAIDRYESALATFQQFQEPATEAVAWHQLGIAYQEGQNWAKADRAYRESARIQEQQGNIAGAASTYGQLAILNKLMQKPSEAEQWYRKALEIARKVDDKPGESRRLHNLANLLANQPNRLPEAHQLATDALAIKQTLDPAAAEIWKAYSLLAKIATAQNEPDKARGYRHLARTTKADFPGTQYELQKYAPLIEFVVVAVGNKAVREQLEPLLPQLENVKGQLVAAIRRVLAGERDVEVLWDDLDLEDSMIIAAILRGLCDPETHPALKGFTPTWRGFGRLAGWMGFRSKKNR
jgi:tetratricopeptide (TPR) repeat protein